MAWLQEHIFLLGLLAAYLGFMVYSAWTGAQKSRTITDFFVGGRVVGGISIGLSFFATYTSTNTYIAFSGKAYEYGIAWLLVIPFFLFFGATSWLIVAPRLRSFTGHLDAITLPDYIGLRFNSITARLFASIITIFSSFLYMTAVFKGIGKMLEFSLDIPYGIAIGFVLVIVMLYTSIGGFHSVVKTDVLQALVMIIAATLIFSGVTSSAGGVGAIFRLGDLPDAQKLLAWDTAEPLPILIGIIFAIAVKMFVDPRQLSRFFALKDPTEVTKGLIVSFLSFLIVFSMLVPIGLYTRLIPQFTNITDTDTIIPRLLSEGSYFNPWTTAFLFLAILSAAMSSLDSVLLVMATTFKRDLVDIVLRRDSTKGLGETRIYVAGFAIITAIIALNPPAGIVKMTSFSGALFAACFMPPVLLGLYWRRGTGTAVITSIVIGVIALMFWNDIASRVNALSQVHEVFPAMLFSMLGYILVSSTSKTGIPEQVANLFPSQHGKT